MHCIALHHQTHIKHIVIIISISTKPPFHVCRCYMCVETSCPRERRCVLKPRMMNARARARHRVDGETTNHSSKRHGRSHCADADDDE